MLAKYLSDSILLKTSQMFDYCTVHALAKGLLQLIRLRPLPLLSMIKRQNQVQKKWALYPRGP